MTNLKKCFSVILSALIFITSFLNLTIPVYGAETSFHNEEQAKTLYELGLFKGTSTTSFTPDLGSTLSRQQGFAMIIRLIGKEKAAEALTDDQVAAALKNFSDGDLVEPSLRKAVAYAIINGLVKGDGINVNPQGPMNGKDFATLLLRNMGYRDDEFTYDRACYDLADKKGCTLADAEKLNDKQLIRDNLVGLSYSSLNMVSKDDKTLIDKLIMSMPELKEKALNAGLIKKTEPTATPTPIPVYTGGGGSSSGSGGNSSPAPTVSPSPLPQKELDFSASVVGAKKIQLTFNKEIATEQATVSLKRSGTETVTTNTYSTDDNTKLNIEVVEKFKAGEYEVIVTGLEGKTITKAITVEEEKPVRIHFLSTKAFLNPNDKKDITAYFRVYNQYNEDITDINIPYVIIASSVSPGTTYIESENTVKIKSLFELNAGDKISVAVIHRTAMLFTSSILTLVTPDDNTIDPRTDTSPLKIELPEKALAPNLLDTTNQSVIGKISLYDQYYNEVTSQYKDYPNLYIVSDKGTAGAIDERGKFIITADSEFHPGDRVALSVYHRTLGVMESDVLTVRKPFVVYAAQIKSIYNKDNLELSFKNMDSNKFYLILDVKNEYGLSVTDLTYLQDSFIFSLSNSDMVKLAPQFVNLTLNGKQEVAMEIMPIDCPRVTPGDITITVVSKSSGMLSRYTLTIN